MKLRVYADTSVFSAYFDDRAPDRKSLTREFWQNLGAYECATSELRVEELRQTADAQLRVQMESLLAGFQIIPLTDEMRTLAEKYLLAGAFTRTMYNDAVHVAAATLSGRTLWCRGISSTWLTAAGVRWSGASTRRLVWAD